MITEATMTQIDARGLSCPQPALLTRQAIAQTPAGSLEVLVDAASQRDNVIRVGQKAGWSCTWETAPDGSFRIVMER